MSDLSQEIKEKLEHIRGILGLVGDQETVNVAADLEDLINQQASRVVELEKEIEGWKATVEELEELTKKQNQRYREALEFYANRQTYYYTSEYPAEVIKDYGRTARQALEREEN